MKKILLSLTLVSLLAFQALGDVASSAQATGATYNLLSGGGKVVQSIMVIPNGTNTIVKFYDSNTNTITQVAAGYTYYAPATASVVTTFVGPTGVTNTFTNTALIMATNVVAAATNTLPVLATYAVPAGTIGQFTDQLVLTRGLTFTNDKSCTIIVNYRSN